VEKRIQGLSLGKAIRNAFFKFSGKGIPTLADCFLYPELGIGRIAERLKEEILRTNRLFTGASILQLRHEGGEVRSALVRSAGGPYEVSGEHFLSTIPLTALVRMLRPEPPGDVLEAASSLGYRDLVIVAVMLNRERVTDQSWIYIPERSIRLGRLHEPKNWSPKMAPAGQTVLVAEYFCFRGDGIWNTTDAGLSETAVRELEDLGFIKRDEVMETLVLRVPKAYPLFEVGYEVHCRKIYDYLGGFRNLSLAGRAGMFKYSNMDHAMREGTEAAREIIRKKRKG
jgi:protoporphyrinogen oxidase